MTQWGYVYKIYLSSFQTSVHLQSSASCLCLHCFLALVHVLPHGGGHVKVPVVGVEAKAGVPEEASSCPIVEERRDNWALKKNLLWRMSTKCLWRHDYKVNLGNLWHKRSDKWQALLHPVKPQDRLTNDLNNKDLSFDFPTISQQPENVPQIFNNNKKSRRFVI